LPNIGKILCARGKGGEECGRKLTPPSLHPRSRQARPSRPLFNVREAGSMGFHVPPLREPCGLRTRWCFPADATSAPLPNRHAAGSRIPQNPVHPVNPVGKLSAAPCLRGKHSLCSLRLEVFQCPRSGIQWFSMFGTLRT
jgi:hypothetical protein